MDAAQANILDLFLTKYWGMKFATSAACTVLRVDQVSHASKATVGPILDDRLKEKLLKP